MFWFILVIYLRAACASKSAEALDLSELIVYDTVISSISGNKFS
jgi:hypothetical protein